MTILPFLVALDLTGGLVNGIEQPYPHCRGVTVLDEAHPLEQVDGIVRDVTMLNPCIGQPAYQVVRVERTEAEHVGESVDVFLGPAAFLGRAGLDLQPGDLFRASVAQAGAVDTALSVDVGGRTVVLRDGQGRPPWGRAAHLAH
jgi:hypothetical protein